MATKAKQIANRIAYVEPNDIYGSVNGVPITPNYEDFCISFNLIAEKVNRYNTNEYSGSKDNNDVEALRISWGQKTKSDYVSFLSGEEDKNGNHFISTYYTDIVYENIKGKSIVEGIGVESIDVVFESFYTPTITIKFVDVRGSSLFGREAAIHEQGKITAENIFGCFFTQPYPKFKLQIKGFYGKDVTYQLTCSNFTGSFNSNNGNFEFIVTFIGYNYALLTDIPFIYLIAAPFSSYAGRKYWDSHINNPSWLINGKPMVTLFEYMTTIKKHMLENTNNAINEEDNARLVQINNERNLLNEINTLYTDFINSLKNDCNNNILQSKDSNNNIQLLLFYNQVTKIANSFKRNITQDIYEKHNNLINKVVEYNTNYHDNSIELTKMPNSKMDGYRLTDSIELIELLNIEENDKGLKTIELVSGYNSINVNNLKNIKFNNNNRLNEQTATDLINLLTTKPYSNKLQKYACLINLYDTISIIEKRISRLNEEYNLLQDKINKVQSENRVEALPFKPTVGNIFKMIMAHLETFIHIMYQCKSDIISNRENRTPKILGVDIRQSDVLNESYIPPFPSVYSKGTPSEQSGDTTNDNFVLGWVGDFSHNFIEENVVLSLWKAVKMINDDIVTNNTKNNINISITSFPSDINRNSNPFANTNNLDISSMGGYLGIRATQLFGILFNENYTSNLTNELITLIGRIDAYNYFQAVGTTSRINNELMDRVGSNNLQNVLKNIALCDSSADSYGITYPNTGKVRHKFETDISISNKYNKKNRCPILCNSTEYSDKYMYSRYYDENYSSLIPSYIDEYVNYEESFSYKYTNNDIYYIPQYNENENALRPINFINKATTDQLLYGKEESVKKKYYNDDIFNILLNKEDVNSILAQFLALKQGTININNILVNEDFTPLINKCWRVGEDTYSNFFINCDNMFTVSYNEYGFDTKNLFPLTKDGGSDPLTLKDTTWIYNDEKNNIKYDNGNFTYTNNGEQKNLSNNNIIIHQNKIYYNEWVNPFSLFGHAFYYMQNNKINNESDSEFNNRSNKVKCLLFLHTLKYNFNYIPNFIKEDKKNGGVEALPYGYILFIGGLLWRRRYYKEHSNCDPIIFKEGSIRFKSVDVNNTLFIKNNNKYYFTVIDYALHNKTYNVSINDLLGRKNNSWEMDWLYENRLINLFENYAENEFKKIILKAELIERRRRVSNDVDSTYTTNFTANTFSNDIIATIRRELYDNNKTVKQVMPFYRERLNNFYGNYRYALVYKNTVYGMCLMFNEESEIQDIIRSLYYDKVIAIDSIGYVLSKNDLASNRQVYIKKNTYDTYLTAFSNKLKEIINNSIDVTPLNDIDSDKIEKNKSQKIEMYYYLKNLYDKWIIQMRNSDYYSVDSFFKQNFVFVDKFYRNIYNLLIINCDKLLDIINNRITDRNASLFSVLGDIAQEHQCLLVSLADYINFGNNDINKDVEELEKAFKPLSYNEMGQIRDENHFVIMWTGGGAANNSEVNYYRTDGFDINNPDDIPSSFKTKSIIYNESDIETRYGYNVPSFGVSFGRQNQSIFKNIKLNMNNPATTEISAQTLANIAELGSSHDHRISFYGQDTFNIFKNYSYECEVETMGNAQIQPLMYFQLLNIPMWHGAYMIKSVTHNITPGNMITRFKGQKMSKYIQPFCDDYYLTNSLKDAIDPINRNGDYYGVTNDGDIILPESYPRPSENNIEDIINDRTCGGILKHKDIELYKPLQRLFNTLVAEIKLLPENQPSEKWSICITSALRPSSKNYNSEHAYNGRHSINNGGISPNAIDISLIKIKDGKKINTFKDYRKMFTVMDILATNHYQELGQVIFECINTDDWITGRYKQDYNVLHISYKGNKVANTIFLSDTSAGKNFATKSTKNISLLSSSVPIEYKAIAKKFYISFNDNNRFRKLFTYYGLFSDEDLKEHFGIKQNTSSSKSGIIKNNGDNEAVKRNNLGNVQWLGKIILKPTTGEVDEDNSIWYTGDAQWLGYDISGKVWSPRFCVFKNMTYGLRALFLNMNSQILKGNNTIEKLIQVWAPPHENDTKNYIIQVAKNANVNKDTYILNSIIDKRSSNKEVCINIAKAIAKHEGEITLDDTIVEEAYNMACSYLKNKN